MLKAGEGPVLLYSPEETAGAATSPPDAAANALPVAIGEVKALKFSHTDQSDLLDVFTDRKFKATIKKICISLQSYQLLNYFRKNK